MLFIILQIKKYTVGPRKSNMSVLADAIIKIAGSGQPNFVKTTELWGRFAIMASVYTLFEWDVC